MAAFFYVFLFLAFPYAFGAGEWKVSLKNVHDTKVLPTLLNPLRRTLGTVYADGAFDTKACHREIASIGATACIPSARMQDYERRGTREMIWCW